MLVHHSIDSSRTTMVLAFRVVRPAAELEAALRIMRALWVADVVVSEVDGDGSQLIGVAVDDTGCPATDWARPRMRGSAEALIAAFAASDVHAVLADPLQGGLAQRLLSLVHPSPGAFNAS